MAGAGLLLVTGASASWLTGCGPGKKDDTTNGGGSGGTDTAASWTRKVSGTVNAAEIGGTGLSVFSVYKPSAAVQGGSFESVVTASTPQMLAVLDSAQKVRGMSLALPGESPTVDATSTALSLVFWTTSITSADASEASTRLEQIQALSSFAPFADYLRAQLPATDLSTLAADPQFQSLRAQVRDDYFALPTQGQPLLRGGDVEASLTPPDGSQTDAKVELTNRAWRYVAVIRQLQDSKHVELSHAVPELTQAQNLTKTGNLVSGRNPVTWGNLLLLQAGAAGTANDSVELSANPAYVDYWAFGPGLKIKDEAPVPGTFTAAEVAKATAEATLATIWFYWAGPALDLLGADKRLLEQLSKGEKGVVTVANLTLNPSGLLAAINTESRQQIGAAAVDLIIQIAQALSGSAITALGEGAAATTIEVLATTQLVTQALFDFYDWYKNYEALLTLPVVAKVEVATKPPKYTVEALDQMPLENGNAGYPMRLFSRSGAFVYSSYTPGDLQGRRELRLRRDGSERIVYATDTGPFPTWPGISDADDLLMPDGLLNATTGKKTSAPFPANWVNAMFNVISADGSAAGLFQPGDAGQHQHLFTWVGGAVAEADIGGSLKDPDVHVVGNSNVTKGGVIFAHAQLGPGQLDNELVMWKDGKAQVLDLPAKVGLTFSPGTIAANERLAVFSAITPQDFSDPGQTVMYDYVADQYAVLAPLAGFAGSFPVALNATGQVLGMSIGPNGRIPTLWDGGEATDLHEAAGFSEHEQVDAVTLGDDGRIFATVNDYQSNTVRGVILNPRAH